METNTVSAGSQPALHTDSIDTEYRLKHIKVFAKNHALIQDTVRQLNEKFSEKAKACGIRISNKGRGRDILPSQPEAVEFFFEKIYPEFFVGITRMLATDKENKELEFKTAISDL